MGRVKFYYGSQAEYDAISAKDSDILYFITDTSRVYKGATDVTGDIIILDTIPISGISGKLYVIQNETRFDAYFWDSSSSTFTKIITPLTAAEVKSLYESNADTNVFTDFLKSKLEGIASGAEVNVQSDWNQTNTEAKDFIKNKPAVESTVTEGSNKLITSGGVYTALSGYPKTATEIRDLYESNIDRNPFTNAQVNKLAGIAQGAEVNVQSDWNQANTELKDFIKNKPSILSEILPDNPGLVTSAAISARFQQFLDELSESGQAIRYQPLYTPEEDIVLEPGRISFSVDTINVPELGSVTIPEGASWYIA